MVEGNYVNISVEKIADLLDVHKCLATGSFNIRAKLFKANDTVSQREINTFLLKQYEQLLLQKLPAFSYSHLFQQTKIKIK